MKEQSFVMPYGKHKGTRICDLPSDYLKWLAENVSEATEQGRIVCLGADKEYQQRRRNGDL